MFNHPYRHYSAKGLKKWRTISARWNNKLKGIHARSAGGLPESNNQRWNITKSQPRIVWGENLLHEKNTQQQTDNGKRKRKKEKSWTYWPEETNRKALEMHNASRPTGIQEAA